MGAGRRGQNEDVPVHAAGRWWEGGRVCDFVRFRSACSGATAGGDMDFVVVLERPFFSGLTLISESVILGAACS